MRFILTFTIGLLFMFKAYAQFPFEENPSIRYKQFSNWKIKQYSESRADYIISIPNVFKNHDALSVKLAGDRSDTTSLLSISRNHKLLKRYVEPMELSLGGPQPKFVFVEDVNGDGLKDVKILIPHNGCCGAYNYYATVIYLFQQKDGSFIKGSFVDWMMDYLNRVERDFDNDGNFEIITQTFQNYGKHNYMIFNLYNFNGKTLINVNSKAGYPIMIQLLQDWNYTITNKVSKAKVKTLARKLPDDFNLQ